MARKETLAKTVKRKKTTTKEDLDMRKKSANNTELFDDVQEEIMRYEEKGDLLIKYSISKMTSNICISEDRTMITADLVTTIWVSSHKRDKKGNPKDFIARKKDLVKTEAIQIPLKEVSLEEVNAIRNLQKTRKLYSTLFLFKEYGKYYLALLKHDISFMETNIYDDVHLCRECSRLSALPDRQGGCQKVRHCWKKLESYAFIDVGYQTIKKISFNIDGTPTCSSEIFCVCKCENFEPYGERPKSQTTQKQKTALRDSLQDLYLELKK